MEVLSNTKGIIIKQLNIFPLTVHLNPFLYLNKYIHTQKKKEEEEEEEEEEKEEGGKKQRRTRKRRGRKGYLFKEPIVSASKSNIHRTSQQAEI